MRTVAFLTLGCKVNTYESEAMLKLFHQNGYKDIDFKEKADVYVINTCTVTNTGDSKSRQMIRKAIRNNPNATICVVGCYSQVASDEVAAIEGVGVVLGTQFRNQIVEFVDEYERTRVPVIKVADVMKLRKFEDLDIDEFTRNTRAFLKIQDGCNNFCTYCIIPYARGRVRSRDKESVLAQAQSLVNHGFVEIVLTGIHTAGYGQDFENYSFYDLLVDLTTKIKGLKRLRISSIEMSQVSNEIIDLIATSPIIVDHLHIPIQAGCDTTLKRMNRHYTTAEFAEKLRILKEKLPTLSVTTDVITGFPGEDEAEFESTYKWIEEMHFNQLHVFPYSQRKGTPAARMKDQVDGNVKHERVKKLMELSTRLQSEFASEQVGKVLEVLIEERHGDYMVGHASNYLKVNVKLPDDSVGHIYRVMIEKANGVELIGSEVVEEINELFDVEENFWVSSIHSDSRYVGKDSIFFCIDGLSADGHKYIEDAVFQGAKCIVYSKPLTYKRHDILYIKVNNVLDELNRVADLFYDRPSYKMTMIGVTGSSGKTAVAIMIKDALSHYLNMGYIGTNNIEYAGIIEQCPYTTPETIFLQRHLNDMVKKDVKGVTLEVSSHGLALKRVENVHFDIAIFTNVYEEHLDFHGTMEHLMASKAKLFSLVDEKGYAIINTDEVRFYNLIKDNVKCHLLTYGIEHKAHVMARNIQLFIDHSEFDLQILDHIQHVSVPVLGRFNISNVLAVITSLLALEMPYNQVLESIGYIRGVDGRMELLKHSQSFHVIVDYCQHEKSYEKVFEFAKKVQKDGRIIAVFGSPGKKNYQKREKIARLANKYCDQVILTAEDNRDEDIYEICLDIQEYLERPVSVVIEDRRIAIEQAIEIANKNDIILILGKGHEQFMASSIGNEPYPGDKYVALSAIKKIFEGEDEDELQQIY